MSHHRRSHGPLTRAAALLILISAGIPLMASAKTACSSADARTPATPAENACKVAPLTASASYTYQTLDYPGAALTIFWGLNDFGDLAGQAGTTYGTSHAMIYHHGQFEPLDPDMLGTYFSAAGGPNDIGNTYGAYADASGLQHGFVIRQGHFETVDFPGHLNSNTDGINLIGEILGVYWDADGTFHGVLRSGHDTPINVAGARDTYPLGLNNKGEAVGYWDTNPLVPHGFYRSVSGQLSTIDVPNAASTAAFAINDRGQIAGYYASTTGALHGFVKTRAQFQDIDVPGATATIVTTINNLGAVAGEYFDSTGKRHGFIATPWAPPQRHR